MSNILPPELPREPGALAQYLHSMHPSDYQDLIRRIWRAAPSFFPMEPISPGRFWQLLAIVVHTGDGPGFTVMNLSLIRLLTDTLRRHFEPILNDAAHDARPETVPLMARTAAVLQAHRDPACAMTWIRRCGDLLVRRGDPARAFPYYSTVINWCTRMSIHNQIDRGQILDASIHNAIISPNHSNVDRHLSDAARFQPSVHPGPLLIDGLLLMNSVARIHITRNEISRTLELLDRADDLVNRVDITSHRDPDSPEPLHLLVTRLRLMTTRLRCSLLSGDMASAEIATGRGMRLMQSVTDPRDPVRLEFRLQAGEFFYRIRNLSELDRLFRGIREDEAKGLHVDPGKKAEMLANWAMAFRERHCFRLAGACHRQALSLFDAAPGQALQGARVRVQTASLLIQQRRFDTAETFLADAAAVFEAAAPSLDHVRFYMKRSELYLALSRPDSALHALNTASDILTATGVNNAPLELAVAFLRARIRTAQDDRSVQAVDAVQKAVSMFRSLKNDLVHFDHRWRFSGIWRDGLIDRLGMERIPAADRIAGLLDIIECDRADIFSTSLPYLVKFSRHPDAGKLYQQYMDACGRLMNASYNNDTGTDRELQRILADIRTVYTDILSCHDLPPGALEWTPADPGTVQALLAEHYPGRNAIALACVLGNDRLHTAVIPARGLPQLVTVNPGESLYRAFERVHSALSDLSGDMREWLEVLTAGDTCSTVPWRRIGKRYYEKLRKWRRKRHGRSLRGMIEAAVLLIEAGLIYQRILAMNPVKSRHRMAPDPDRPAYEFLYRVLIDPVVSFTGDNADLIIFTSGILSRIPFEALVSSAADGPEACVIFSNRTITTFRSPALFHRVMTGPRATAGTGDLPRSWFTPHIGVNQHTNPYEPRFPDPAGPEESLQHDLWFRAHEATAAAFVRHAPVCREVLLETHATFDRFQPFLSRMIFALSEPFTVMDILSRLTFHTTSLMILAGCESDQAHDDSLDHAGISLSEAMLCKGAEQVLATKWLVDAKFSREFIRDVKERIRRGESAPDALAETQRIRAARPEHPGKWASFSFSGRPGINHRDTFEETLL